MAEINTCEQYVLSRLHDAEIRADSYQDKFYEKCSELAVVKANLEYLMSRLKFEHNSIFGCMAVIFDAVYEKYDKEDYARLVEILGAPVIPDEEVSENG